MAGLMRGLATSLAIAAFGLGPATAHAEPSFTCQTRTAEMNGLRVTCSVSGATDDQLLRIVGDQSRPLCEANVTDGSGVCGGMFLGSSDVGPIVAVLLPSGAQFDVRAQLAVPTAPLQSFPLPENAGATDASTD